MAHVKKGNLIYSLERAKHLRSWAKRLFWKRHRKAEKKHIKTELKTHK